MSELGEGAEQPQLSPEDRARLDRWEDYAKGLDRRFSTHTDGTPLTRDEIPGVIADARMEALEVLTDLSKDGEMGIEEDPELAEQAVALVARAQLEETRLKEGPTEEAERITRIAALLREKGTPISLSEHLLGKATTGMDALMGGNHMPSTISKDSLLNLPTSSEPPKGNEPPSGNSGTST
jgi:hypothetical protein